MISSHPGQTGAAAQRQRLRRACRDLEAVFLGHLVRSMRSTAGEKGIFGKAPGAEIYGSMMDDALASALADAGGAGLADLLYRQLQGRLEEAKNGDFEAKEPAEPADKEDRPSISG
jgi:flagellar protein FlgJ